MQEGDPGAWLAGHLVFDMQFRNLTFLNSCQTGSRGALEVRGAAAHGVGAAVVGGLV